MNTDTQIIDYKIIHANNPTELGELARKEIMDGWQPFGSVDTMNHQGVSIWCQSMIKSEPVKSQFGFFFAW